MSEEEVTNSTSNEEPEVKTEPKTEEPRRESESPSHSRSSRREGPPPTKLYVGNLPDNCKRSELTELFEKYGKIEKCDILRNFAFVVSSNCSDVTLIACSSRENKPALITKQQFVPPCLEKNATFAGQLSDCFYFRASVTRFLDTM